MIPLSTSEAAPLEFDSNTESVRTRSSSAKIGWLHSTLDEKGGTFDIQIKDIHGRVKWEQKNCQTETEKFGILANIPTLLGEELEVVVTNVRGAKNVKVFLN